jgi:hypothetical protein
MRSEKYAKTFLFSQINRNNFQSEVFGRRDDNSAKNRKTEIVPKLPFYPKTIK